MTERPILFSGPMVRALLEGRKAQTRRVVKDVCREGQEPARILPGHVVRGGAPSSVSDWVAEYDGGGTMQPGNRWQRHAISCPYGQPGDRLWVRETWGVDHMYEAVPPSNLRPTVSVLYAAEPGWESNGRRGRWRPSIHMPRWASRLTLEVTEVRVQRLQEISESDATAEGPELWIEEGGRRTERNAKTAFRILWDSINGAGMWGKNPWVWAISFKVLP